MSADLKAFIKQCVYCQVNMPSHPKELLIPTPSPAYPFQQVACNYFEVKGHSYLVYTNRYSGWATSFHFTPSSSTSVELIKCLRKLFSDMGIPEELACDGGKNLTSYEMKEFLKTWGIKLRMSSAHYPQSNR